MHHTSWSTFLIQGSKFCLESLRQGGGGHLGTFRNASNNDLTQCRHPFFMFPHFAAMELLMFCDEASSHFVFGAWLTSLHVARRVLVGHLTLILDQAMLELLCRAIRHPMMTKWLRKVPPFNMHGPAPVISCGVVVLTHQSCMVESSGPAILVHKGQ